jgi:hypothetical protein
LFRLRNSRPRRRMGDEAAKRLNKRRNPLERLSGRDFMERYRVYKLDEPKGRIVKGKDLFAADDAQAMHEACKDPDCPVCEVWRGTRKIDTIE